MTRKETLKSNRLIAVFMDLIPEPHPGEVCHIKKPYVPDCLLQYDNDWEELMPVVEKIESLYDDHHGYFVVQISGTRCDIQGSNLWKCFQDGPDRYCEKYDPVYCSDPAAVFPTKIESTYYAVVQFIKWYNETLNK